MPNGNCCWAAGGHFAGLQSEATPPQEAQKTLEPFAQDILHLIRNLEYRKVRCNFQSDLKKFIADVKKSGKVYVPCDKTRGYYEYTPEDYRELIQNNVTKEYRKTNIGGIFVISVQTFRALVFNW